MSEKLDLDALEAVARAATPGPWATGEVTTWGDDDEIPQAAVLVSGSPMTWDDHGGDVFDPVDAEHIAAFDPPTVLALITRLREAERERDEARWAAGIVGDVARESSGGWQAASAELHATQARLREAERNNVQLLDEAAKREARVRRAEAVIEEVDDLVARHHLDTTVGQAVFKITGDYYKPINHEGKA